MPTTSLLDDTDLTVADSIYATNVGANDLQFGRIQRVVLQGPPGGGMNESFLNRLRDHQARLLQQENQQRLLEAQRHKQVKQKSAMRVFIDTITVPRIKNSRLVNLKARLWKKAHSKM